MPYSCKLSDEENKKCARAYGKEINMSWKHANQVCGAIRGMTTKKAIEYLNKVLEKKAFIPFKNYNTKMPHRAGGTPGRYPKKATGHVLAVLESAIANAEHKGLDSDRLKIIHTNAYKAFTLERVRPKGRGGHGTIHQGVMHNIDLTNVEIIVKEV